MLLNFPPPSFNQYTLTYSRLEKFKGFFLICKERLSCVGKNYIITVQEKYFIIYSKKHKYLIHLW